MKVTTAYPVIVNNKVINRGTMYDNQQVDADYLNFCNADGDDNGYYGPFKPGESPAEKAKAKEVTGTAKTKTKKGNIVDKAKGVFGKAKDSGAIDSLGQIGKDALNKKKGNGGAPAPKGPASAPKTGDKAPSGGNAKPPMSTTAKVLIGVAFVAVVFGIYKLSTKRGK